MDHLVCAKVYFGKKRYHGIFRGGGVKSYDVGKLSCQGSTSIHYLETVLERFKNMWSTDGTLEEKWQNVKDALTTAANDVLGFSLYCQLDWCAASLGYLQPLLTQ